MSPVSAPRRLFALAGVSLAISLLLLALYGRQGDTATLSILGHALSSPAGTDSTLYMRMGERAFQSGDHRIYEQLFFAQHEKFIYPPSSLFMIEGFDRLQRVHVNVDAIWLAVLITGWAGTILTGVLFYRALRRGSGLSELFSVALLGILFLPFAEGLYRGQVQVLLTLLWGVSVLLWTARRPGWAGFALAITCLFKPQLAIFLLWGVLRREWRFAAAFAATAVAALFVSIAHFGLRNHLDYLAVLSYLSRHGEALWANQSMNGTVNRLIENGDSVSWNPTIYPPYQPIVYALTTAFSLLCIIAGLLLPWRGKWAGSVADYVLFGCLSVLTSPIAWEHHYGYFYFAIVLLAAKLSDLTRRAWWLLVACVLALANRWPKLDHHHAGFTSIVGDYLFVAGILLCVLLVLNSQRAARPLAEMRVAP